jgi:cytidylate kinase
MIVAIDGPAGAGKSTVSRLLAERLGFRLIDTGAMYRCVALAAARAGVDLLDGRALGELATSLDIDFAYLGGANRAYLDGHDVTDEIRTSAVSLAASQVSAHSAVREALVARQRELGNLASSVMEGRDIGTVVFPNADVKVFLTASLDERSRRRLAESNTAELTPEQVAKEIADRDHRDSSRAVAPLRPADDAVHIDTTGLTLHEVVQRVVELVRTRQRLH